MHKIPAFLFHALRFDDLDKEAILNVTDGEWQHALSNWESTRILLSFRVDSGDDLPDWVRERIDQYLSDTALRFEHVKATYSRLAMAFQESGIDHVVIKGFSLFPGYTQHPKFRPHGDIDLYCPPESILHARDAIIRLGYVPNRQAEHLPKDHLCTLMPQKPWRRSDNLCDPDMPICFELHFCWWNDSILRFCPKGLDQFWNRRITRQIDEFSFAGLDPIDNLAYTALNVLRDLFFGFPGADRIYALARFLHTRADDCGFWQRWRELHDQSLRRLETIPFRLASLWFGCKLAEEIREEVERFPAPVHAWFKAFSKSGTTCRFSQAKDGLWLHLNFVQGISEKSRVLLTRLLSLPTGFPTLASVPVDQRVGDVAANGRSSVPSLCRQSLRYTWWFATRVALRVARLPFFIWRGVRFQIARNSLPGQFWNFFAASFCFDLGLSIFFFLYNLYLLDRGFNERFLGTMTSAMNIGAVACTIPAGIIINRFGLRKSLLFCFLLVPCVSVARTFLLAKPALLLLAFLGGLVTTVWAIVLSPAITRLTDEKSRPLGFSVVFSSGIGMGVLANGLAGHIPGWLVHLRPVINVSEAKQLALVLGCAIVALGLWPVSRLQFPSTTNMQATVYPRNPFLWRFLPAVVLWSLVTGSLSPLANVYFSHYLRVPLERIGAVFSFASFFQVIAVLAAPLLFRRIGVVSAIAATQLAIAIALCCLASTSGAALASIVYVAYTGLLWMSEPGLFSLLMNRVRPDEQAGASAMNFLAISIAQALAVAAAGASFERFGYRPSLYAMAVLALVSALFIRCVCGNDAVSSANDSSAQSSSQETMVRACTSADAARPLFSEPGGSSRI